MITHQLSLKGKAAADVAEVAKHLNITHDVRDAENAGGIAECTRIILQSRHLRFGKHGHAIYAEKIGARLHCVAW